MPGKGECLAGFRPCFLELASKLAEDCCVVGAENYSGVVVSPGNKCRFRLKIVDDDVDWQNMVKAEEVVEEEEEDEAPVVGVFSNNAL